MDTPAAPFFIKDCALISIATGIKAYALTELRDKLAEVIPDCVYYHFWGRFFESKFKNQEFHNDFAHWASETLHDNLLAERLAIIDPSDYPSIDDLRKDLIEIIDKRIDELDDFPSSARRGAFQFVRSQIIVFQTPHEARHPRDLINVIPLLPPSCFFYHFIDARRRTPDSRNDFSAWLAGFGDEYKELIKKIDAIDPYFTSLREIQEQLQTILVNQFVEA